MKIEIRTLELLEALNKVEKGLLKNHEVLSGIKIETTIFGEGLSLQSANHEVMINTSITDNLQVLEKGKALLPGKYLIDIIKKLNGEFVTLETKDNDAIIKSGRSRFKLRLLDIDRFPDFKDREFTREITLKTDLFKKLVSKTIHAISDKRPIFQGINFKAKDNKLIVYATDSFRIARCEVDINLGEEIDIIIPGSSLQYLIKIIESDEVVIKLNNTYARFEFGSTYFETRLIEGTFPDMERFFGSTSPIYATFDKGHLIRAVERVTILLDEDEIGAIKLKLFENKTYLSIKENELGGANEELEVKNANGEIELALSSKFLLDALKTYDEKEITINFTEPLKPIEIYGESALKNNHIILPIRIA